MMGIHSWKVDGNEDKSEVVSSSINGSVVITTVFICHTFVTKWRELGKLDYSNGEGNQHIGLSKNNPRGISFPGGRGSSMY